MVGFVKVAKSNEIQPGQAKMVEVDGKKIALFNVDGAFYAIDDTCTHRGGPLSEGELNGNEVSCPWHGAKFDVTSGAELGPPAPRGVTRYDVRIDGEDVTVELWKNAVEDASGKHIRL